MIDVSRFLDKILIGETCWVWTAYRNKLGYGVVGTAGHRTALAHRVSYELFVGPIADRLLVCHKCDNPPCVRPSHLFLGTDADNSRDRTEKGRTYVARGEDGPNAKVTEKIVLEIRRLYAAGGETTLTLAKRFRLGKSQVYNIVARRSWSHLPPASEAEVAPAASRRRVSVDAGSRTRNEMPEVQA